MIKLSACVFLGYVHWGVDLRLQDGRGPSGEKAARDPSGSERTGAGEVSALGGGEGMQHLVVFN